MSEVVSVGCRLPNGYVLEVGFKVSHRGRGGAPFAMYVKGEDYAKFTLRGTNQHLIIRDVATRKPIGTLPNAMNREPYINDNVPKALWERWVKDNAKNWALKSGQIFLVPKNDADTVRAAGMDAKAKSPAILEPLSQTATMKLENHEISRRTDE